jgi:GntR family transcriptional regulator
MKQNFRQQPDLSRSAVPRYLQLSMLFKQRIDTGVWRAGEQIPTIDELVEECGVARATVRQALGVLESDGLLARFRAKGTFVLDRGTRGLWCDVQVSWQDLLTPRGDAVIKVLSDDHVDVPINAPVGLGDLAPRYRYLRRQHWHDNSPYLIADVYIDAALSKKLPKSTFTTLTAMRIAESLPGVVITDARQTITMGGADIDQAAALELPLNAAVAHVQRVAVDQRGVIIAISNGVYRGDIVRIDLKLK